MVNLPSEDSYTWPIQGRTLYSQALIKHSRVL